MWEELDKDTKKAIDHWCKFIIEFMKTTDYRKESVRDESPEPEPSYFKYN
jgi:hypothetical protein